MRYRVIALSQPLASKVVSGETREVNVKFNTSWRGTLAIYASKFANDPESDLPRGAFVGLADLADTKHIRTARHRPDTITWTFANPIAFDEPVPHPGKGDMRRFWYADIELELTAEAEQ